MPKYLANFTYSSGSWARLINTPEDRTAAAKKVVEALGGTLECIYWQMDSEEDGLAIANFPDSISASAVQTAINKTGAFKTVDTHELLTSDQLRERLILAKDATRVYDVPGQSN
jgi:uncharacterized protein with GYD domain